MSITIFFKENNICLGYLTVTDLYYVIDLKNLRCTLATFTLASRDCTRNFGIECSRIHNHRHSHTQMHTYIQGVHQLARAKSKKDQRKSKEDFANYKDIKI